jgi:hypothetical protein
MRHYESARCLDALGGESKTRGGATLDVCANRHRSGDKNVQTIRDGGGRSRPIACKALSKLFTQTQAVSKLPWCSWFYFIGRASPQRFASTDKRLQSTPEPGAGADYDGARRRKGSMVHIALDILCRSLLTHGCLHTIAPNSGIVERSLKSSRHVEVVRTLMSEIHSVHLIGRPYQNRQSNQSDHYLKHRR